MNEKSKIDPGTAKEDTAVKKPQAVKEKDDGSIYVVQWKDQLTEISMKVYGNYHDWKKIFNANRDKIKDPNQIFYGQRLNIPDRKK